MSGEALSLAQRLSDRVNPLLVRETQQVLRSKAFVVVMSIALASICAVAFFIAAEGSGRAVGRDAFTGALVVLCPILTFLIPLQAFVSMQQELRAGVGEQLLLSKLTPARIVRGKLAAAMVQVLLFLSVFGPLLALTFLLRGTDVPSIAFFLVFGLLVSLMSVALAIALGAVARVRMLTPILFVVTAAALFGITTSLMAVMWELVRELGRAMREPMFWVGMGGVLTAMLCGLVLLAMVAGSLLTHAHENRSTPFRLFWLALLGIAVAWIWGVAAPADLRYAAPILVILGVPGLVPVWWFALTEDEGLSPRAAHHVPRSRLGALLAAPLLPGGGRGVLYVLLTSALLWGTAGVLLALSSGSWDDTQRRMWTHALFTWYYALAYCCLGRLLRTRLRRGLLGNWIARASVLGLLVLGCVLPVFVEVLSTGRVGSWSPLHVTNPFWTIADAHRHGDQAAVIGLPIAGVLLLLVLPAGIRGLREVWTAAGRRRAG